MPSPSSLPCRAHFGHLQLQLIFLYQRDLDSGKMQTYILPIGTYHLEKFVQSHLNARDSSPVPLHFKSCSLSCSQISSDTSFIRSCSRAANTTALGEAWVEFILAFYATASATTKFGPEAETPALALAKQSPTEPIVVG